MELRTVRAKFDENKPISFVKIDGKSYPCYYPTDLSFNEEKEMLEVMFTGIQHHKESGKFSAFRVQPINPNMFYAVINSFTNIDGRLLASAKVYVGPNNEIAEGKVTPGWFSNIVKTYRPGEKPDAFIGWVSKKEGQENFRLEGLDSLDGFDMNAVLASTRQRK